MSDRWPIEDIPDTDRLYMRVHRQWFKDERIAPGFFRNLPDEATGAMSTDWDKYATPEQTRQRARQPELNAVIELVVGEVRRVPEQVVRHTPIQGHPTLPDNRAHTDVAGPKKSADLEIQDTFSRICRLIIPPDAE